MRKPKILLILGSSGTGKTTLADRLQEIDSKKYKHVISATSREQREGENDLAYLFMSEVDMREASAQGELIAEVKNQFSNLYGTFKTDLDKKKTNIIVVSLEGMLDVLKKKATNELKADISVLRITTENNEPFVERKNRMAAEEEKYANCTFKHIMDITKTKYACVSIKELRLIGGGEYQLKKLMKDLGL